MKKIITILFLFAVTSVLAQNDRPLWLRYPAISPDGSEILFTYKGDIYKVAAAGGTAVPLTMSEGNDYMPVWSPDGQWICFASDRTGNYDLYIVHSKGGAARRLTWHSAGDVPYSFSPDGQFVYFGSPRMISYKSDQFPVNRLPQLYRVSLKGGKEEQVSSISMEGLKMNKSGTSWIYHDKKGGEDPMRKHHTSAIARDLWMYEQKSGKYTQLTNYNGEDRNPVWSPDEKQIYYLCEQSGSYNIWFMRADNPASKTQVTRFEKHPVRSLSMSGTGALCFSYDGEIYTVGSEGGAPRRVAISIVSDERFIPERNELFTGDATEMQLSPNGKEVVFVVRGEVFVSAVESGMTRRITSTPGQERSAGFSPDGRSIIYASERDSIWGIYQTSLSRSAEKYFFNSTVLKEEVLVHSDKESFQPRISPDGAEVAFIENRTAIRILNIKTKAVRTVLPADKNYSYSDGDQWFDWSPDSKYLLVNFLQDNHWHTEVGLVDVSGNGKPINLTNSGYSCDQPKWMAAGKMMIWFSNRNGMKNHGSHGWESDVYGMYFTQEAFDRSKLSKEVFALLKEQEKKEQEKKKKEEVTPATPKAEPVKLELDGIEFRKERLTLHSSNLADAVLSDDGEQLYYLCRFDKGYDLWVHKKREHETRLLIKLDAASAGGLQLDKEGKNLFLLANGTMVKIDLEKNERKDLSFKAEMRLNAAAERAAMFEHVWRQAQNKFYVSNMHGVDWRFYKQAYAKFLPHINNNRDFAELLSEMLGELNASHTGGYYFPQMKNPDETASLGVFYDEVNTGAGAKIAEVLTKGPLRQAGSKIKAGTVIEKIDGVVIAADHPLYELLNRKAGKPVLLSLLDEAGKRWEETVTPITLGEQNELLYHRWVKMMEEQTEKLSNGRLGYVHVRSMDDEGFRAVYEKAMGKCSNKEALIVDTRFNGGGWLHEDLAVFLNGKRYIDFVPRERKIGSEPESKWTKPSVLLMSEGNYSDAHMFPFTYKTLGIGKLIGMPVPGTGTAVWWETLQDPSLVFGIPQVGIVGPDGKYLENNQLEPDFKVMNEPGVIDAGRDQQLEKAVAELLLQLGR